jgi:hypothetical protein
MFKKLASGIALTLLFLICGFFCSPVVIADESRGIVGVAPAKSDPKIPESKSWFVENLKAGETVIRQYDIFNYSNQKQEVQIDASDSTVTTDGNLGYRYPFDPKEEVGSWINLKEKQLELSPKSKKTLQFELKIPKNTASGEYSGLISVELPASKEPGSMQMLTRVGVRLYITVLNQLALKTIPSDLSIYDAKILGYNQTPSLEKASFKIRLANTGNVFSETFSRLIIQSPDGEFSEVYQKNLSPQSDSHLIMITDKAWKEGMYKLKYELETSPLITSNKKFLTESRESKSLEAEFKIDKDTLEKIKNYKQIEPVSGTNRIAQTSSPVSTDENQSIEESLDNYDISFSTIILTSSIFLVVLTGLIILRIVKRKTQNK